ncbi:pancreatic lipase-related protein 2 [Halyomorpha halys]|uniref:pancreatic lipase-related protein 2 n=1 Tax=Halyomorpha halys TaxID=286706 RepID=UPI0006D50D90|nr:pancreatic lipase-related protein 2-like [Halyomorpha halys]
MLILLCCLLLSLSGTYCLNATENINGLLEKMFGRSEIEVGDVKFYLFNSIDIFGSGAYTINDQQNISSVFKNFVPTAKTKIIVHGWKGSQYSRFCDFLKNAYLPLYNYNIIIADWSEAGAHLHPYFRAAHQVPRAAEQVGIFIEGLCSEFGLRPEDLHLIGHSLGSHVAGLSGKNVTIGKIGRVTGLDPARPSFSYKYPEKRISTDSGLFVDIIHTCGGYLATPYQLGHADFFPNAGRWIQPGCGIDIKGSCSHQRAYRYYAESIRNPLAFVSTPCLEWSLFKAKECDGTFIKVTMGEFTPNWAIGSYYLYTNKKPPFNQH